MKKYALNMTNKPTTTTFSLHTADSDDSVIASFKFESGELKDEGRVGSETVREYDIAQPGHLRLSHILLPMRRYSADT